MREKNYDKAKAESILKTLLAYPEGLWFRKLAKESNVPVSTLHRYLDGFLAPLVENTGARDAKGHFFGIRLVRLRSGVAKRLNDGLTLDQLLLTTEIMADGSGF